MWGGLSINTVHLTFRGAGYQAPGLTPPELTANCNSPKTSLMGKLNPKNLLVWCRGFFLMPDFSAMDSAGIRLMMPTPDTLND